MAVLIALPAPQSPPLPAFSVVPVLDTVTYTLRFQWNDQDGSFYLTVLDEPGQTVLMGAVRIVVNAPLFRSYAVRQPPGYIIATDTSGNGIDPGINDLGQGARVQLLYETAAELGL